MNRLTQFYDQHRVKLWFLMAVALFGIGLLVGLSLRGQPMANDMPASEQHSGQDAAGETAKIWTCSMHPQIRRDGPGKCPLCGMDLVPVKKSAAGVRTISISPDVMKLMNIQTVPVTHRYVTANVRMVGKIEYDGTRLAHITAWVSGRLDRLFVDYIGIEVKKGDHMVYIYSEELYSAQVELIQALKYQRDRPASTTRVTQTIDLAASAREKLRLLGLWASLVAA
jgi:membrane fusion protein, copper/silver efflux system